MAIAAIWNQDFPESRISWLTWGTTCTPLLVLLTRLTYSYSELQWPEARLLCCTFHDIFRLHWPHYSAVGSGFSFWRSIPAVGWYFLELPWLAYIRNTRLLHHFGKNSTCELFAETLSASLTPVVYGWIASLVCRCPPRITLKIVK